MRIPKKENRFTQAMGYKEEGAVWISFCRAPKWMYQRIEGRVLIPMSL